MSGERSTVTLLHDWRLQKSIRQPKSMTEHEFHLVSVVNDPHPRRNRSLASTPIDDQHPQ
jgi:hypothetical protein